MGDHTFSQEELDQLLASQLQQQIDKGELPEEPFVENSALTIEEAMGWAQSSPSTSKKAKHKCPHMDDSLASIEPLQPIQIPSVQVARVSFEPAAVRGGPGMPEMVSS